MKPLLFRGLIIKYNGLIANIPRGFVLCDGTNGTPDLRARFVKGVLTNSTNPGTTGGEDTHVLSLAELPVHNHGSTETAHTHTFSGTNAGAFANRISVAAYAGGGSTDTTSSDPLVGVSVGSVGGGLSHENRPSYYETLYIMKNSDN